MIIKHHLQLLRYYRVGVIFVIVLTTVIAAGLNATRLILSPVYTAQASVAVLPTEAEYNLGRDGGGARSTVRGLTATYIEYMKSRPVVEAALEKISGATALQPPQVGSGNALVNMVKGARAFARRVYRTLDSGTYVPLTPRQRDLQRLMSAISVGKVADSFILRVSVSLRDPNSAAAAANALAEAYVERVAQQLSTSAGQIGGFLQDQIALREAELSRLRAQEEQIKSGIGMSSVEDERGHLVTERETERRALLDVRVALGEVDAEIDQLRNEDVARTGRSRADLSSSLAAAESRRRALVRSLELRRQSVAKMDAELKQLNAKEEPLLSVQMQINDVQQELAELRDRMLTTSLTGSSAMAQVRVIDPAIVPLYPSSPHAVKNTAAAFLAGLLMSVFIIVLIDSLSDTVKTTADLERLIGTRSLGLLRHKSVTQATRPTEGNSSNDAQLEALGGVLERGLMMVRAFEAPMIQVTGFLESARLCEVSVAICKALASQRKVHFRLPPDISPPSFLAGVQGDPSKQAPAPPDSVRIECLHPVSAELNLAKAAGQSPALVCVLPAGKVSELAVRDFHEKATESGLTAISFILLAP